MRVVVLAAGAGGMYCGSCLRDNRVVATFRQQGRDALLLPLYTPIRTDEVDVSEPFIRMGGINVFLQQQFAYFRRRHVWADRLLDSRPMLQLVSLFAGATRAQELGPMTVSVLKGEHGPQQREVAKLIDTLRAIGPDVVHIPNLMLAGIARPLKGELKARVVCSLAGEDIFLDLIPEPFRTEAFSLIRASSKYVDRYLSPTQYYGRHAAKHFSLPSEKISYAPLGIEIPSTRAPTSTSAAAPFTIGYLARICPEKGLAVLVESFLRLRANGRNVRLVAAGYIGRSDRPYLRGVMRRIHDAGAEGAFRFLGEVSHEKKLNLLQSIDVFSVPTVYHESKGLYVLEAMAAEAPVVQPNHGSFPELVEGDGLLYGPENPSELDQSIERLMDDAALRNQLSRAGRQRVSSHYTNMHMAEATWSIYEQVCATG